MAAEPVRIHIHTWGEDDAADRRACSERGIHYCEPGHPWPGGKGRSYHPLATKVPDSWKEGWPGGDTVLIRCLVCGVTWTRERPQ